MCCCCVRCNKTDLGPTGLITAETSTQSVFVSSREELYLRPAEHPSEDVTDFWCFRVLGDMLELWKFFHCEKRGGLFSWFWNVLKMFDYLMIRNRRTYQTDSQSVSLEFFFLSVLIPFDILASSKSCKVCKKVLDPFWSQTIGQLQHF